MTLNINKTTHMSVTASSSAAADSGVVLRNPSNSFELWEVVFFFWKTKILCNPPSIECWMPLPTIYETDLDLWSSNLKQWIEFHNPQSQDVSLDGTVGQPSANSEWEQAWHDKVVWLPVMPPRGHDSPIQWSRPLQLFKFKFIQTVISSEGPNTAL